MTEIIRVFDRYEIVRQLTTGGMGDIFLARQLGVAGFERLVILKSLRPELVEDDAQVAQFLDEARNVARLNHPNIVAVLEVDEYRGVYFIAMEYIAGIDLGALLGRAQRAGQRVPYRVSAGIVCDAARGLAHAHAARDRDGQPQPLIHRDISPQNVMVRSDGIAKVLDFGIATVAGQAPEDGRVQGKLRYMAPEQMLGRALTPAADQFSLGVVLWELCTLRRLFLETAPNQILGRVLSGPLPAPSTVQPDVPPELDALVSRMIAFDPAQRFASCGEVADALRAFNDAHGGSPERAIERFVAAVGGAQIAARTRDLSPTPVTIAGLLPAVEVSCAACGRTNQRRHRHCTDCGAPLALDGQTPSLPPGPAPRPAYSALPQTRTIARPSIHTLLFEQASALRDLQAPGPEAPIVLLTMALFGHERVAAERGEAVARHLSRQVLDLVAAQADAFGATVLLLRADEAVFAFDGDAKLVVDARRALRFAAELAMELRRCAERQGVTLAAALVITRDVLESRASPTARRKLALGAVEKTRSLAPEDFRLFVARELTAELHDAARFTDGPHAELRRVDRLLGDTPQRAHPMFGRRSEVSALMAALRRAEAGESGAICVLGEPGMGKSRLLAEVSALAAKRGVRRVELDASSLGPQLRAALGDDATELRDGPTFAAFAAQSEQQPTLVCFDDLDRAPPEHQRALAKLARLGKLWVVVTATQPTAAPWATPLPLAPLGDDRILAAAQAFADGLPLPPAAVQPILERARGNPGLGQAVTAALIAGEGIRRDGSRWVATRELPRLDLEPASRPLDDARLAAAGDDGRRALDALAVYGRSLNPKALLRGSADPDALAATLLHLRLITVTGELCQLEPPSLGARLLAELDDDARAAAHEAVGRALLDAGPVEALDARVDLVAHLLAGEARMDAIAQALAMAPGLDPDPRAIALLRAALPRLAVRLQTQEEATADVVDAVETHGDACIDLLARNDVGEAVDLLRTLLRAPSPPRIRAAWLRAHARTSIVRGRLDDAHVALGEASALAHDDRTRAEVAALAADVHEARGELSDAIERATESLDHASRAEMPPDFGWRQSNALGRLYLRSGDIVRAEALFTLALEHAREVGSARGQALALSNCATVDARSGRIDRAVEALEQVIAVAESCGERVAMARALHNRGRIHLQVGRLELARADLERCAATAIDSGWAEGEALARQALDQVDRQAKQR